MKITLCALMLQGLVSAAPALTTPTESSELPFVQVKSQMRDPAPDAVFCRYYFNTDEMECINNPGKITKWPWFARGDTGRDRILSFETYAKNQCWTIKGRERDAIKFEPYCDGD